MRRLVWFKTAESAGWTCSQCAWIFEPSGDLAGNNLEELKRKFQIDRDQAFTAHTCAKYPK